MAKDIFHEAVKVALQKEGWTITHDPLMLEAFGTQIYVDLGAEQVIAAQRNTELIAVEIKSFLGNSYVYDFYQALGQYVAYLRALKLSEPERTLILAVPLKAYKGFFTKPDVQASLRDFNLNILVYDNKKEIIVHWFYV
ncbi:element excision factor XisH family protein [Spirosoma linguale]|uniref:XisH protein n=1 Tax=Spirosoma linguale (strain ATCC 33905 / DSM 74 / LMG 10896 / Claus 1) TaxID=504472 RepID=D2QNY8_SPILD|nr:XisH protein [Spirosoma linguale DSM 74]